MDRELNVQADFWRGKRVFLTGHTGFKGGWLSLWLRHLGAEVHGFALEPPTTPNLFTAARVMDGMVSSIGDIRDFSALCQALSSARPEIVFHMAAQPLVRLSYTIPVETYATNVMGTVHMLEAARWATSVRAVVIITTDKCYENKEWPWGYREDEPMGGYDPYSSSKGCAELVTSAYRRTFFEKRGVAVASVRAGNVIGGGDWAEDRLIPDILRALSSGKPAVIRNPHAIRPWQHVLEPLSAYLSLAERLYDDDGAEFAEAWNFGPVDEDARPVAWIADKLVADWGDGARWVLDGAEHPHEATYLKLDISKARQRLGWSPRWRLAEALSKITEWYRGWMAGADSRAACLTQIAEYSQTAGLEGL